MVSARSRTSLTRKLCLTQGRVMPTVSTSWKASLPITGVGTCPDRQHHRDGVHVGGGDAGDGIGRTRSRGDQADAALTGRPGIAVRGMAGGLFVPDQDVLDLVLLEHGVVDMQDRPAGIPEDVLDALVDQRLDDDLGTAEFHPVQFHLGHLQYDPTRRAFTGGWRRPNLRSPRRPGVRKSGTPHHRSNSRTGLAKHMSACSKGGNGPGDPRPGSIRWYLRYRAGVDLSQPGAAP